LRHSRLGNPAICLALAAVAACATEPQSAVLTGPFGGRGLGLVATRTGARFQLACATGATGPLRLQSGGTYKAGGSAAPSFAGGTPWSLDVTARLAGSSLLEVSMVFAMTTQDSTYRWAEAYELSRGAAPDFSAFGCLASLTQQPHAPPSL